MDLEEYKAAQHKREAEKNEADRRREITDFENRIAHKTADEVERRQKKTEAPSDPNPKGWRWSSRYGKYISQQQWDKDANFNIIFFAVLIGGMILFMLLYH